MSSLIDRLQKAKSVARELLQLVDFSMKLDFRAASCQSRWQVDNTLLGYFDEQRAQWCELVDSELRNCVEECLGLKSFDGKSAIAFDVVSNAIMAAMFPMIDMLSEIEAGNDFRELVVPPVAQQMWAAIAKNNELIPTREAAKRVYESLSSFELNDRVEDRVSLEFNEIIKELRARAEPAGGDDDGECANRLGRLSKAESELKKTQLLALLREHPTMADTPGMLAEKVGVSNKTATRWIAAERKKWIEKQRE